MKMKNLLIEDDFAVITSNEQKLTHVYLAHLISVVYKENLRWNTSEGCWHMFDQESGMWNRVNPEKVIGLLMELLSTMRQIESERVKASGSARGSVIKEIERAESNNFLSGTERLLRSMKVLAIDGAVFDADPYLVGLEGNQCLDLRTSDVRSIAHTDYLTKKINTPYIAGATCPLWNKSVLEWACDDKELADFLQVWCGYCLSGLTTFQGFLFLYGGGRNGKSVFLNVISKILGEYAIAMNSDTLMMRSSSNGPSGDIARLHGARFATCNELPEGKHFDEVFLKSLTGQDTLTARFLYKEAFNFKASLKLMISGNHTPIIKGTDPGIWRRVNLVPFVAKIDTVDTNLTSKLMNESAGILNWMIEGWKKYQQNGLVIPKAVTLATSHYKSDMDIFGQWMEECVEESFGSRALLQSLYRSYSEWSEQNGLKSWTKNSFNRKLKEVLGRDQVRTSAGYCYEDLAIKDFHGWPSDIVQFPTPKGLVHIVG